MGQANGIRRKQDACQKWDDLVPQMSRWSKSDRMCVLSLLCSEHNLLSHPSTHLVLSRYPFVEYYTNATNMSVGILHIDGPMGMRGACNLIKNGSEFWTTGGWVARRVNKTDSGAELNGELPDGQLYGYVSSWLMNNWHPAPKGHRVLSDFVAFWMLESAYNFIDRRADELMASQDYPEFEQYLKRESGEWKSKLIKSIESGDIRKSATSALSEDMFPRPVHCGKPSGQCLSGIPFVLTAWQPKSFNTHSKLSDYMMNPVPFEYISRDLGWRKVRGAPGIQALENKEGGPGWMDDKASWRCDRNFYAEKLRQFAEGKKSAATQFGQLSKRQLDEFHADLIRKELYLQFVVKVPLYGNGSVSMLYGYRSRAGAAGAVAYLTEIGGKTLGEPSTCDERGFLMWQGLRLGQKYELTVVPYNLTDRKADCKFSNIFAF